MQGDGEGAILSDDDPRTIRRDLALLRRSRRERWPTTQKSMDMIYARVEQIALNNPDDEIALRAAAEIRQMKANNDRFEAGVVEHHHLHELGPVTAENIEQQRQIRLARIAAFVADGKE